MKCENIGKIMVICKYKGYNLRDIQKPVLANLVVVNIMLGYMNLASSPHMV